MIQQQSFKSIHQVIRQYQFQGPTKREEVLLLSIKISLIYREATPMITQQWNAQTLQYLYLVYHLTWQSFIGHQINQFSTLSMTFWITWRETSIQQAKLLLTGDFNIHVNNLKSPDTNTFLDVLDSFGLHNHISFPTHCLNNTLDLVITSEQDNFIESSTPDRLFSDHNIVYFNLITFKQLNTIKEITYWKLKNINMTNFNKDVELHLTTNFSDTLPLSGKSNCTEAP